MRAYIEPYLKNMMRNLGIMTHFCINEYGMSPETFSKLFPQSFVARQIFRGNPRFLAGMSGNEMAALMVEEFKEAAIQMPSTDIYYVTPEYWAGWAMAYYQWYTAKSFAQMYADGQTYSRILKMYHPFHEADLTKVVEALETSVHTYMYVAGPFEQCKLAEPSQPYGDNPEVNASSGN